MSWDAYVQNLCASGHVDKAAILGLDGGGTWAASAGLTVSVQEAKQLIYYLANTSSAAAEGIVVGGRKYMFLQGDQKQLQGKKGPSGVSIARSQKCLIIGVYKKGQQPGNCRKAVENMCDYLSSNNY